MRVGIVGSRQYRRLDLVSNYVRGLPAGTIVVSGGAVGVDLVAAAEARKMGLQVVEILPDWERYGKAAGFHRNGDIVSQSDRVVAFWDGESHGTESTIRITRKAKKPLVIIEANGRMTEGG